SREGTPPDDRAARTKSAQSSPAAPAPVFVRSTATSLAAVIAAVKLSWIDVLLRHLVLVVGFLGGLLAVRRREHITVDAVGQLFEGRTKEWVDAGTSAVAAVICTLLVLAGLELVELSLKWPSEVLPGIDQWALQLMFPVGFGLMGVHFAVRAWHSSLRARGDERPVGVDDDRPEGGRP
ncbi:MAG: TRAP transporter small permease, partial [Bradymonadaceae bacterium]